jgi:glycosyltransferase involved in cell wall biosynthesis
MIAKYYGKSYSLQTLRQRAFIIKYFHMNKSELYEFYSITDADIVPSLYEPFGYVAVEMMMHALPLIVTATSGLNEVVDENSGIKVPLTELPDKVEISTSILAQKILYLLQHPGEAKKLGKNARKRFSEKLFFGYFS